MRYTITYNIGDRVWFMYENKVHNGIIEKIIVKNYKSILNYEISFVESYRVNIDDIEMEGINCKCTDIFGKDSLFSTKDKLIKSL